MGTILQSIVLASVTSVLALGGTRQSRTGVARMSEYTTSTSLQREAMCPTSVCTCYWHADTARYHISCINKHLTAPPSFSKINVTYYLITFSGNNNLTVLPARGFENLSVERINLLKNSLASISPDAFSGLETVLKELYLQGNGKLVAPYKILEKYVNLQRLQLQHFQHSFSNGNDFGGLPALEDLTLYQVDPLTPNDVSAITSKLPNLKRLELKDSDISQVPVEALINLKNLEIFHMKQTKVETVYSNSFDKLEALLELDLSHNNIHTIDVDAFIGLEGTLIFLDLSHNNLKNATLASLSSKTWVRLETLTLSYNTGLQTLPDYTLPGNVFHSMPKLNYLNLEEVGMQHVRADLLTGLANLYMLELSSNEIQTISPGTFRHTPTLYELHLSRQFQSLEGFLPPDTSMGLSVATMAGLESSLGILNLDNTPLKSQEVFDTIKVLRNLRELFLSQTGLTEIPPYTFAHNKKLETIVLNDNDIETLYPTSFWGIQKTLKEVSFIRAQLTNIGKCVFQNFTSLMQIKLSSNPLHCDCHILWLYDWIRATQSSSDGIYKWQYICSTPIIHRNKVLVDIPRASLTCDSTETPEACPVYNQPTTTPRPTTESQQTTLTTITTQRPNKLKLIITGTTSESITVAWNIADKSRVSGFLLTYFPTTSKDQEQSVSIHRDEIHTTLSNLQPGQFYYLCLTAEIGNRLSDIQDCRTINTKDSGTTTDKLTSSGNLKGRQLTIIIVSSIIGVIVLIAVIVAIIYIVVKYKLQKLKQIQLSLPQASPGPCTAAGDADPKVRVVPNVYSDIGAAASADTLSPGLHKGMEDENPYHSLSRHAMHAQVYNASQTYATSGEVEENAFEDCTPHRHSAPSRLDAKELFKLKPCQLSRPLPATPKESSTSTAVLFNKNEAPSCSTTTSSNQTENTIPVSHDNTVEN